MKMKHSVVFAAIVLASTPLWAVPEDVWACRESHPAVVNPVLPNGGTLSLRGEWDMITDLWVPRHGNVAAECPTGPESWWTRKDARRIRVPGCWEAQGVGTPGWGVGWKCWWDFSPRPLRNAFFGEVWYRKLVTIPANWQGRRIWLKVGGVNAQGWFFVNGERVAWSQEYCATRKYEITDLVRPGETAWIVANVCNDKPSRRGCLAGDNNWGGLIRDVELEATPQLFIDDAWVRGDFDKRLAEAHVEIGGEVEKWRGGKVRVTVEGEIGEVALHSSPSPRTFALEVPLRNFRPWSPEHPNLYTAKVELVSADGTVLQTRWERFGVRKFETRGNAFYLNDRPFFMRAAGWHWIWPMEGLPYPDRETFLKRARLVRSAGFNLVRTHTSCPFPEFFEAADEAGLMVEPELPYYQDAPTHDQPFDPIRDMTDLVETCRRYPSFAVLSGGNEGWFGTALSKRLYDEFKRLAPDRLMIGMDRWYDPKIHQPDTSDYQGGPMTVWPRGSVRTPSPFVCHEYLNLVVKLDSRLADRFTGCWEMPGLRTSRAAWLATNGLDLAHGDRLQDAQHVMQSVWRKYGLEAARGDPLCSGYSYWSLQDSCSPQKGAFAGQALFDPFWNVKPHGDSAADVAVYNSPTCLLLDDGDDARTYEKDPRKDAGGFDLFVTPGITNRVRRVGDAVEWRFRLAHYGERPFEATRLVWRLVTSAGETLLSGDAATGDQPLGPVRDLTVFRGRIPSVPKACKATLEVRLMARNEEVAANSWDYWIFPPRRTVSVTETVASDALYSALKDRLPGLRPWSQLDGAKTVIAAEGSSEAQEALRRGLDLVTLKNTAGPMNALLGWWWMGSQMGAVLADHPILSELPHEGFLTPLLFRIMREGTPLPGAGVAAGDLVLYGEGGDCCYLYLAARKLPDGNRQVIVSGLDLLSDTPEGLSVWSGIVRWLADGRSGRAAAPVPTAVDELNARFGRDGRIVFRADRNGEPIVDLKDVNGACSVALRGAHLLSCRFADDPHPLLLVPTNGYYGAAGPRDFVYGGSPLIWPWFGMSGRPEDALWRKFCRALFLPVDDPPPEHGFARYSLFGVKGVSVADGRTAVTLELRPSAESREFTDADFRLLYTLTLGPRQLTLRLETTNLGPGDFVFRCGYHPFFAVSNSFRQILHGVDGSRYTSNRELPYDAEGVWKGPVSVWSGCDIFSVDPAKSVVRLVDPGWKREVVLTSTGACDMLLWSLGAKCATRMGPMNILPEECDDFVCVEPANINDASEITLGTGRSHVLETVVTVRY